MGVKAWLWFFSSYGPLWLMLGLRFDCLALRLSLIAFAIFCVGVVALLVTRRREDRPTNTTLSISGDAGGEVSGYLATYLLPFLTVPNPDAWDLAAYGIFILVAGLVYVRSGLMQINPTVYLLRRRVLRATMAVRGGTRDVFVITRRERRAGETLKGERFSDRVYIDHAEDA